MIDLPWDPRRIRLGAILLSLLMSGFITVFHGVPNDDAFTYARTAQLYLDGGPGAAFAHYGWAVYPMLIGELMRWLSVDAIQAGLLINGLLFALLVSVFLDLVTILDPRPNTVLLGAGVILLMPQGVEFRFEVIRDVGHWSFALLALLQLVRFSQDGRSSRLIGFALALLTAALFRAEALVYLVAAPLTMVLTQPASARPGRTALRYGLGAAIVGALLSGLVAQGFNIDLIQGLTAFYRDYGTFLTGMPMLETAWQETASAALFNAHAGPFNAEYMPLILIFGLSVVLVGAFYNGIGGPYLIVLVIGAFRRQLGFPRSVSVPVMGFIGISLTILLGFVVLTRFLTARYAFLLCLTAALWVPLVIRRVLDASAGRMHARAWRLWTGVLFLYCFIDAFVSFGTNRDYLLDAAQWVREEAPPDSLLLTNSRVVAYYSQRIDAYDLPLTGLTAAEIEGAPVGSVVAVVHDMAGMALVESPSVRPRLQRIRQFPSDDAPLLGLYRRNALP